MDLRRVARLGSVGGVGVLALAALGCGGLFAEPDVVMKEAERDQEDPAERKRQAGDFDGAIGDLTRRLQANPADAHARRLLGDVFLTRGQFYQQRWKENLQGAWQHYSDAITLDPQSCLTWGRLAAVALASAENPELRVSPEAIAALPLETGWNVCKGAPMLELEWARAPLQLPAEGTRALAESHPEMVRAVVELGLDDLEWKEVLARPEIAPGVSFVVFPTAPIVAGSVDGSKPRSFMEPEWITVGSFSAGEDRILYLDRRFPERVPAVGVTRVTACPGSEWEVVGPNHIPKGTCGAGVQNRAASEIYDPTLLRPTGTVYYFHPSIAPATVQWSDIAEDSVRCMSGNVGRQFVDTPSCQVSYDRAIPQRRSIKAGGNGITALSQEHAAKMVDTALAGELLGPKLADHLARGRVAGGLPYSLFAMSQPDLTGCKGRGMYQKMKIADGAIEFACKLGATTYQFREATLLVIDIGGS